MKKVIHHDWKAKQSLFQRWRPVARYWLLTLECGHTAERRFRYRDEPAAMGSAYLKGPVGSSFEQALPAPGRVRCKECKGEMR